MAGQAEEASSARGVTFTFDTGMLIALERRKQRATDALRAIVGRGLLPVVPAVVVAEWWRGARPGSDIREEILVMVIVEPMPPTLCRAAGEALGAQCAARHSQTRWSWPRPRSEDAAWSTPATCRTSSACNVTSPRSSSFRFESRVVSRSRGRRGSRDVVHAATSPPKSAACAPQRLALIASVRYQSVCVGSVNALPYLFAEPRITLAL